MNKQTFFNVLKSLVFLIPFLSLAQNELKCTLLNYHSGLPSNHVSASVKQNDLLYVTTQRGLSIYDGYRFIKHQSILNPIDFITQSKDKIYFSDTNLGLFSLEEFSQKPKIIAKNNFTDGNPNNDHYCNLFVDSRENIWCSDFNNLKYFNPKTKKEFHFLYDATNKALGNPVSFHEINNSEVLIATSKGVFLWNSKINKIEKHFNKDLKDINCTACLYDNNQLFIASSDGKLIVYNIQNDKISTLLLFPKQEKINQIQLSFQENRRQIIACNSENIYFLDEFNKQLKQAYHVENAKINSVYIDDETYNIWVATNQGLLQLSNNINAIATIIPPIKTIKTINGIVQDKKETIYISSKSNEIWQFDTRQNWKKFTLPRGICTSLFCYQNKVLIASTDGLYQIIDSKIVEINLPVKEKNYKKAIIDQDNMGWIILNSGKIIAFDFLTLKEMAILNPNDFFESNTWNSIFCDNLGQIWLAGWMPKSYGIAKFNSKNSIFEEIAKYKFNKKSYFSSDYYNQIAQASNNKLLFSCYGGWNQVAKNGLILKNFNTDHYNVPNNHVEGITEDAAGNIWFATAEGLNCYNPRTNKVVRLTQTDGLLTDDVTNGFCNLSQNKIAIGANNAIQIIDLKKILTTILINKLEFTSIVKDGTILSNSLSKIKLNHDFTSLDLYFSSLSYSEKEKIIYRYKFKSENEWIYLGSEPKLALIKLSPGDYTIQIQAGDNLGNWQKKSLEIILDISPPFYYTWWFLLASVVIIIFIAYKINRFLVGQEKEKGKLIRKINEAEMKMLRSQMNPHFMFNSLNSINSFIIQQKSVEASGYLTTFSKLMRNILDNSRHESISLEKEIATLNLYLELESVRLENKFDFQIIYDKDLEIESIKVPPLIIQPFVENAIWHGLHNKKTTGNLVIAISSLDDEKIIITISDDGIGRAASALLKKEEKKHKSYGIEITRNRLKLINANNNFEIIDLFDHNQQPIGTKVKLEIFLS